MNEFEKRLSKLEWKHGQKPEADKRTTYKNFYGELSPERLQAIIEIMRAVKVHAPDGTETDLWQTFREKLNNPE